MSKFPNLPKGLSTFSAARRGPKNTAAVVGLFLVGLQTLRPYDQIPGILVSQEGQVPLGVSRLAVTRNPTRAMRGSLHVGQ